MMGYRKHRCCSKAFTLLELMMTVALAAVLMVMAVPSFTWAIRSNRLTAAANELVTALNLARSEAVKRNRPVTIRKSGTQWEDGWNIFIDPDGDGQRDDDMDGDGDVQNDDKALALLRVYAALPGNFTLRSTPSFVNRVTYQASGTSGNGTFVLCDNSDGNNLPEPNTARVAIINTVGRVRMGPDSDGDGIPEKAGGEITSCAVSPFTG
jgi:type IV fimbrial biogenesis protein FimT